MKPDASDRAIVQTSRIAMLIPVAIGTWLATNPDVSVGKLLTVARRHPW